MKYLCAGKIFSSRNLIVFFAAINTVCFAVNVPYERHHYKKECKNFSEEAKRFSDKLNDKNLKVFCEDFNDAQREQAMQMASQQDMNMTPDQAVEMVAAKKK